MGPARSPRALGPHAGLRALACRSISALPGLLAATSLRRPPLSLLPPSLPPFLARSWPARAPPRAAAGRTRASGKPLGRRGRSAHGAGQVRGAPGAPAVNLGNPVRAPPATPRGPPRPLRASSPDPPTLLRPGLHSHLDAPWTPSAFAPRSSGSPPPDSHPDPSDPLYISAASPGPSLQSHPSSDPSPASSPWLPPGPGRQVAALEQGRWTISQSRLARPGPAR